MSHAVRIDYRGISIECQSICELASSQLCKLEELLDRIEEGSLQLLDGQTEALRIEIRKNRDQIQAQINRVLDQAKRNASKGVVMVDSDYMGKHSGARHIIEEAKELELLASKMADTKIIEFEALLNNLMNSRLERQNERLRGLASGKTIFESETMKRINDIEDEILKQYVYLTWLENTDMGFEQLLSVAKRKKDFSEENHYEREENNKIDEIKKELKEAKIEETVIRGIVVSDKLSARERLRDIRERANAEIVSEKVRKESVKIIVNAIKKRGFIVDAGAIKIDRINNQVNILAQKPSGAKAEFKVYLNGKFEYRFDGYEGQACQNDIQPFMKDLEEIYGIKVINRTELWNGNPDKNTTMKYQQINHNTVGR